MISFLLDFLEMTLPHSGVNIANLLLQCFDEFGITSHVLTITLDNASNNGNAMAHLKRKCAHQLIFRGRFLHVRCLAHIFNLVTQAVLSLLKPLLKKLRFLVKHTRTPQQFAVFKQFIAQFNKERLGKALPKIDVANRWNSTCDLLTLCFLVQEALTRMGDIPVDIVDKNGKSKKVRMPTMKPAEWEKLKLVHTELLGPMNAFTSVACQTLQPTMNHGFELCHDLDVNLLAAQTFTLDPPAPPRRQPPSDASERDDENYVWEFDEHNSDSEDDEAPRLPTESELQYQERLIRNRELEELIREGGVVMSEKLSGYHEAKEKSSASAGGLPEDPINLAFQVANVMDPHYGLHWFRIEKAHMVPGVTKMVQDLFDHDHYKLLLFNNGTCSGTRNTELAAASNSSAATTSDSSCGSGTHAVVVSGAAPAAATRVLPAARGSRGVLDKLNKQFAADSKQTELESYIAAIDTQPATFVADKVTPTAAARRGRQPHRSHRYLPEEGCPALTEEQKEDAELAKELNYFDYLLNAPRGEKVLQWWYNNKHLYPVVSTIARNFLGGPTTSVKSESTFSSAKNVIGDERAGLCSESLRALMCSESWILAAKKYGWHIARELPYK